MDHIRRGTVGEGSTPEKIVMKDLSPPTSIEDELVMHQFVFLDDTISSDLRHLWSFVKTSGQKYLVLHGELPCAPVEGDVFIIL
jgi:hypothetical protein